MIINGRCRLILKPLLWIIYLSVIVLLARQIVHYTDKSVFDITNSQHELADASVILTGNQSVYKNKYQRWSIDEIERYEKWINEYEKGIVNELGNNGKPAKLYGRDKYKAQESLKKAAVNIIVSNKIPLNRKLPDIRDSLCTNVTYESSLPTASVIIIFYNEPWSLLMRTVRSVLDRTPDNYLKEIILVDDHSDAYELQDILDYYIFTRLLSDKVKIIRLSERVGLIRARLSGAKNATGDVLVFLDAHCEVIVQWLEPLLQRIKEKRNSVLMPIIDSISEETLEYIHDNDPSIFQIGGFTWSGHFTWIDIQAKDRESRKTQISPVKSPTMAGGLFAIDRNYFWEIGSYDDKMDGWGGENLEMSFRIWQCGGLLEIIPCSRVGHIFRNFHPYKFPNNKDTHGINTARLVHVWMDEYKRLFFLHREEFEQKSDELIGDLSERIKLRQKLKCKNFKWYLDNIYPEKFIPDENVLAYGRVKLENKNLCLDNLQRDEDKSYNLGLYPCHSRLFPSQLFSLSNIGELRREHTCATINKQAITAKQHVNVKMTECNNFDDEKEWILTENKHIIHVATGLCLDATGIGSQGDVFASPCSNSHEQYWSFDFLL
ncbi:hypothetical protein PV325_010854 [Microctonus aethiopoides]|uniref:Polypeptide N-acetylgalactosaminyltransferase n=1 Tax=Microctonus aethiopoides TaxID=144406 RepID=A0AA39FBF2_9HYME|nr:hypothetical protein PV325_010854 [Microctonus aethiopoides]KAK0166469.1 hypothetical protein PV328_004889 [Microctonus aethiopoides]